VLRYTGMKLKDCEGLPGLPRTSICRSHQPSCVATPLAVHMQVSPNSAASVSSGALNASDIDTWLAWEGMGASERLSMMAALNPASTQVRAEQVRWVRASVFTGAGTRQQTINQFTTSRRGFILSSCATALLPCSIGLLS
jgi:hypothetical protein